MRNSTIMDRTGDVPENSSKDMESVRYSNESLSREGSLSVFQDQADFAEIPTPSEGSVITPDASMMNFFQFDDTYTSDLDNRELIVRVDNPEKHSGALDSYVTFRITTNVSLFMTLPVIFVTPSIVVGVYADDSERLRRA